MVKRNEITKVGRGQYTLYCSETEQTELGDIDL